MSQPFPSSTTPARPTRPGLSDVGVVQSSEAVVREAMPREEHEAQCRERVQGVVARRKASTMTTEAVGEAEAEGSVGETMTSHSGIEILLSTYVLAGL